MNTYFFALIVLIVYGTGYGMQGEVPLIDPLAQSNAVMKNLVGHGVDYAIDDQKLENLKRLPKKFSWFEKLLIKTKFSQLLLEPTDRSYYKAILSYSNPTPKYFPANKQYPKGDREKTPAVLLDELSSDSSDKIERDGKRLPKRPILFLGTLAGLSALSYWYIKHKM